MNNEGCQVKACIKPMVIATVVVAIFLFAYEWLVHGVWLMPLYQETASLWRPMDQMGMHPWCIIRLLALGFLFSALFCKCKKAKMQSCDSANAEPCKIGSANCPIKKSLCFGVVLGLLIGTMNASAYLWMPIPGELAVKWLIAGLGEGIGVAIVLGALSSCKFMCVKK